MAIDRTQDRRGNPFTVTVRLVTPAIAIVHIVGDLDLATAPACRQAITDRLRHRTSLVLDLSRCSLVSSTGLDVLRKAQAGARAVGVCVVLSELDELVARVLRVSGVDEEFGIYPSMADAVRALTGPATDAG